MNYYFSSSRTDPKVSDINETDSSLSRTENLPAFVTKVNGVNKVVRYRNSHTVVKNKINIPELSYTETVTESDEILRSLVPSEQYSNFIDNLNKVMKQHEINKDKYKELFDFLITNHDNNVKYIYEYICEDTFKVINSSDETKEVKLEDIEELYQKYKNEDILKIYTKLYCNKELKEFQLLLKRITTPIFTV
ncbi:MAG: hypothetical protein ACD_33C00045G0020 [uncultured bacterium]|nr:MAG: hypothetical protein ACD_33C00045G0020 [uncultured bacterium]